jgi:CheY-like chemotaxis protein
MAKILLIDDDDLMRASLHAMLGSGGHEVIEATDGTAGVAEFRRQAFDLVISDIVMPGKDGVTTIGEIHQASPTTKIIAMSSADPSDPRGDLEIAWAYGAARSLRKPIRRVDLLREVDALLAEPAAPATAR